MTPAALVPFIPVLVKQIRKASAAELEEWAREAAEQLRDYIPEPDVLAQIADLSAGIARHLKQEG